jgi:WD40 repeat protein
MAKVFVSYSRKDITFAKRLAAELQKCEVDFWIDWEGIPPTVDWWREIEKGIEEADIFLFLISPDSARSKVCGQEIETAVRNGKRIIPIVVRHVAWEDTPASLTHLNYIFFREEDDFDAAVNKLITAIQTDYEWAATHRRLQVKALDWERNSKDNGFLLRGRDLQDAEQDLALNTSKEPHPTDLQREYVFQSRKAADRQRRTTTSLAIGGVVVLAVLAVVAIVMAVRANQQAKISRAGELAAQTELLIEKNFQNSLLLGVESFREYDTTRSRNALFGTTNSSPHLVQFLSGHTNVISSIRVSPDGKKLASGSRDNTIILWDLETGQPIGRPLSKHTGWASSLSFSPDGKILASGSCAKVYFSQCVQGEITLWDVETYQPIGNPLVEHISGISSVAFSPDGKTLVSGSDDGTIILWDMEMRQPIGKPLQGHTDQVSNVAFSPNGKILVSGSWDSIILWNIETRYQQPLGEGIVGASSIAFSPDGKTLALGTYDNTITLWNMETKQPISQPLTGHADQISSIAFSPDGKVLASGSLDNTIRLWDTETYAPTGEPLSGHTNWVSSITFSPNGKTLVSGSCARIDWSQCVQGEIILWDVKPGQPFGQPLSVDTDHVFSVAVSPDDKMLASGAYNGSIILWDMETRQSIGQPLTTHKGRVNSLAFSPDGRMLASGSDDSTIILWNVQTGEPMGQPMNGNTGSISSVAFSPNGKTLASGGLNSKVIFWDVQTHKPIGQPLTAHTGGISSVAFSSDGRTLASGSKDKTIILWDVQTHKPIGQPLTGHIDQVFSVAFSPDGKTLASGGRDSTIILWDVATRVHQPMIARQSPIRVRVDFSTMAFSPDGKTLASSTGSSSFILWNVETRQAIGQPVSEFMFPISSLAFSTDGKILASGSEYGPILWDLDPESWIKKSCQRAGRNLTRDEWAQYLLDLPYPTDPEDATCPQWPLDGETTSASAP